MTSLFVFNQHVPRYERRKWSRVISVSFHPARTFTIPPDESNWPEKRWKIAENVEEDLT
jgi:hypothetical protein